ncbi:PadR family transcriptional regulator [Streptomyces sp. DH12]|uniref:PadR family transcriptional regulator n=1 Tax=Streptomyces sp. DH12 TaxID=2857010 RepID=UPI001E4CC70B|nr:PadR family transcriptional regulator [Streptomyces sp. DH12]
MPSVFAHGRLRLYLLRLLDEAPRHGYEVIRLLEERFQGLYAPSAGTVYPRLAKLEAEGLVRHASEGGRKVYSITGAGRAELAARGGELADLEREIRASVAELAAGLRAGPRTDVRGAAGGPRAAADGEAWRGAEEELRRARQEWREQTRRARDESRRAREEARAARRQAAEARERAREEVLRVAQRVQERVSRGDWPAGVREGLTELTKGLGGLFPPAQDPGPQRHGEPEGRERHGEPERWRAADTGTAGDPARDLERLLDRFRDDVRDAARDHGMTPAQLTEARHHLAAAAHHLTALLRGPGH